MGVVVMKKIILVLVVFLILLFSNIVFAASKLEIKDVIIEIDGDKDSSANEAGGSFKVKPGSKVEVQVKVENIFSSSEDIEIENVEVALFIENIDNGDDIDEESKDFDLKQGKDKKVKFTFTLPYELDHDDTYTLELTVTGEDINNTDHTDSVSIDVEIDKEKHELLFKTAKLGIAELTCIKTTRLEVDLLNIGEEDEDDVVFTIQSTALDLSYSKTFDLSADIDDDDNNFDYSRTIDVTGKKAGIYQIELKAQYDDKKKSVSKILNLDVKACASDTSSSASSGTGSSSSGSSSGSSDSGSSSSGTSGSSGSTGTSSNSGSTSGSSDSIVTSKPPTSTETVNVIATPTPSYAAPPTIITSSQSNWWESNKWVVVFIITDVLLILIAILIVVAVVRRRK